MLAPYLAVLLSRLVAGAAAASLGHPGRAGWGTPRRAQRSAWHTAQLDGKLDAQYRVAREPSRKIHQEVNQKIREFIIPADKPEVNAIFGCLHLSPFPLPPLHLNWELWHLWIANLIDAFHLGGLSRQASAAKLG